MKTVQPANMKASELEDWVHCTTYWENKAWILLIICLINVGKIMF